MPYISSIRFRRARALLLASATTLPAALPSMAQETGAAYRLDPVIVEIRDAFSGAADRATSMYVSELELDRARTGDLKDVFAGIASVSVGGGIPIAQKIFINGVDMLNLGVSIDGAAQNNRAFHHVTSNAIDPGLLKQVRADATVSPADAGPFALAGSVVFETVDPEDVIPAGQVVGGNVRLSYADNGGTAQGALTLAGTYQGFSWLGYVKRAEGGDYETGSGATQVGSGANLVSTLGKIAYESQDGHRFELSAQQLRDEELRQFRPNFGGQNGAPQALYRFDTLRKSYSFTYENVLAEGLWDPRVTLGYSENQVDRPLPSASNGTTGTFSASVSNTFNLGGGTVVAGVDYQETDGNYYSPPGSSWPADITERSRNVGLFAQARLDPTDRLRLSFGARYDRQTFTGTGGQTIRNGGLSGNASVVYALTESFAIRGGVSSVFGGIDIEDNYTFNPAWNYTALRPARANNATIGFDYEVGTFKLGGEVFLTRFENARTSTFAATGNSDFESRGFNLGATYGWNSGFARFTLSHSEVSVNGVPQDSYATLDFGAPLGTVMAFEIEQETGLPGLTVGGGVDAALPKSGAGVGSFGNRDFPGYEVVNVFAEYVPPSMQNMTIRAEVTNLFDVTYADRATYGGDFRSIDTLKEPGRTISVVAVLNF
ncbi:TonB-dependent receptor plug domain-containing protein [Pseudooceanicola batsensis]|nr:TonB-dependent receptor [Pseudooceanicola batsensis]